MSRVSSPRGQASLMMLAVVGLVLAGALVFFAFGQALGARGKHQRGADLAAISAPRCGAQVMRDLYPRLFEPPFIEPASRTRATSTKPSTSRCPGGRGARRPSQRRARARGRSHVPRRPVRADAGTRRRPGRRECAGRRAGRQARCRRCARSPTAELAPVAGERACRRSASGGGYEGPLAYRQGKPMRPDVALAFDRMAAAARGEAGPVSP